MKSRAKKLTTLSPEHRQVVDLVTITHQRKRPRRFLEVPGATVKTNRSLWPRTNESLDARPAKADKRHALLFRCTTSRAVPVL